MADNMPSTYTTTTTTTTRTIFFDKTMLRRKEVILKMAEMLFCILGMICVASTYNPYSSPASFYYFCATTGLVVGLILFIIYVTHLRDKAAPTLRLNFVEMVYSGILCIFFIAGSIAAITRAQKYYGETGLMVAGVFGLILAALYAIETFIMYRAWRSGATMSAAQTTTVRQVA
ncbi:CKLF-like MARVEL transmembrane domain-containing protein 4 [Amphibalanus amphitrite]|uniref:CKLF-like MARVEL transmembrane domain-containing protein 4 n=1 Tax=Amphibalanus amphitrite TaxID=1232801 RepID=A0A6A4WCT7_AMPAM|nr:uncharacterized protein LOC122381667 [Amphibalanus amphitrite]XP_043222039.1 uncharacterized protein LOC122381667 [Amphibalanus amphitrite]XP_043222040.1 uncharacterized protein LOC122381667 [Amphibalanus amphitrite]KAF0303813.1 CKLF-like MARVEL transmembrane domain-containing protein 4 [Amphibalanus amphitrite]